MQIDMRIMELLASKLCHDLVSPVSAINNGVELIEDIGGSVVPEAMKLIGDSGQTASRRLRLYRLAYGRAGSETQLSVKDVRAVAEQYLANSKITFVWPVEVPGEALAEHRGLLKVVLNMIALGEEVLPYGGVMTVREILNDEKKQIGCRLEIVGRSAALSLPMQEALENAVKTEDLTPRTIQAYLTGRYAEQFSFVIGHDHAMPERLDLSLTLKPEEPIVEPGEDVKVS